MKGDIALAGFLMTAAEWDALDSRSRAQLVAAAHHREDAWVVADISDVSGALRDARETDDSHR